MKLFQKLSLFLKSLNDLSHHRGNVIKEISIQKFKSPPLCKAKLAVGLNPDSFKPLLYIWSLVVLLYFKLSTHYKRRKVELIA